MSDERFWQLRANCTACQQITPGPCNVIQYKHKYNTNTTRERKQHTEEYLFPPDTQHGGYTAANMLGATPPVYAAHCRAPKGANLDDSWKQQ